MSERPDGTVRLDGGDIMASAVAATARTMW